MINWTLRHVATHHLHSIEIDNGSVITPETKGGFGIVMKVIGFEFMSKIIGGVVGFVVVNFSGFIVVAITQFGTTIFPGRVVKVLIDPVRTGVGAVVQISPL